MELIGLFACSRGCQFAEQVRRGRQNAQEIFRPEVARVKATILTNERRSATLGPQSEGSGRGWCAKVSRTSGYLVIESERSKSTAPTADRCRQAAAY